MGTIYRQFSLEDRIAIARLSGEGASIRQIAAALDRAPSSVARELKRNSGVQVGYKPVYAQHQAAARRWSGSRLDRDGPLRQSVLEQLAAGWSPEQVSGRSRLAGGGPHIGTETIYRFIYAQIRRHNDFHWRRYLPRGKFRRGWRGTKGGSPALHMRGRVPLTQRPAEAEGRDTPGHWEADLMAFSRYGQNILMLHERMSRVLIGARLPSKRAEPVAEAIGAALAGLPPPLRQSVTFDNCLPPRRRGAPSSPVTRTSIPSASPPSSAIRMRPGKKAASRTPSAACAAPGPERPIWPRSTTMPSPRPCSPTTIPLENALTGKHQPRPSLNTCCTSNENPHSGFRRDDIGVREGLVCPTSWFEAPRGAPHHEVSGMGLGGMETFVDGTAWTASPSLIVPLGLVCFDCG